MGRNRYSLYPLLRIAAVVIAVIISMCAPLAAQAAPQSSLDIHAKAENPFAPSNKSVFFPPSSTRSDNPLVVLTTTGVSWKDVDTKDTRQRAFIDRAQYSAIGYVMTAQHKALLCPTEGLAALSLGGFGTPLDLGTYNDIVSRLRGNAPSARSIPQLENVQKTARSTLAQQVGTLSETVPQLGQGCPRLRSVTTSSPIKLAETDGATPSITGVESSRLGAMLSQNGRSVHAIGPGGAVLASDNAGRVIGTYEKAPRFAKGFAQAIAASARTYDTTFADVDDVVGAQASARTKLRAISSAIAQLPAKTQVIVVSVSEGYKARNAAGGVHGSSSVSEGALQLAMMSTDNIGTGFLRSGSMSRRGIISLADIPASIVSLMTTVPVDPLYGSTAWATNNGVGVANPLPFQAAGSFQARADLHTRLEMLSDVRTAFAASQDARFWFYAVMLVAGIIALAWGALRQWTRGTSALSLWFYAVLGLFPASSLIANALPAASPVFDWAAGAGGIALGLGIAGVAGAAIVGAARLGKREQGEIDGGRRTCNRCMQTRTVWAVIALNLAIGTLFATAATQTAPDSPLFSSGAAIASSAAMSGGIFGFFAPSMLVAVFLLMRAYQSRGAWPFVAGAIALALGGWIVAAVPAAGANGCGALAMAMVSAWIIASGLARQHCGSQAVGLRRTLAVLAAACVGLIGVVATIAINLLMPLQVRDSSIKMMIEAASLGVTGTWQSFVGAHLVWLESWQSIGAVAAAIAATAVGLALHGVRQGQRNTALVGIAATTVFGTLFQPDAPIGAAVCAASVLSMGLLIGALNSCAPDSHSVPQSKAGVLATQKPHRKPHRTAVYALTVTLVVAISALLAAHDVANIKNTSGAAQAPSSSRAPTILILTEGVSWNQFPYTGMSNTAHRLEKGIAFNVVPLAISSPGSCPIDNWLALSAGRLVRKQSSGGVDLCTRIPQITAKDRVPLWNYYRAAQQTNTTQPTLGSLGDTMKKRGLKVTAIGPGAAIAVAQSSGKPYGTVLAAKASPTAFAEQIRQAAKHSDLVIVDASQGPSSTDPTRADAAATRMRGEAADLANENGLDYGPIPLSPKKVQAQLNPVPDIDTSTTSYAAGLLKGTRFGVSTLFPQVDAPSAVTTATDRYLARIQAQQARRFDAAIGGVPSDARLLAASTMSLGTQRAFNAGLISGPGITGTHVLSGSVRQADLAQVIDITPTLMNMLGIPATALPSMTGAPLQPNGAKPDAGEGATAGSADISRAINQTEPLIDKAMLAKESLRMRSMVFTSLRTAYFAVMLLLLAALAYSFWPRGRFALTGEARPKRRRAVLIPHMAPAAITCGRWLALTVASVFFASHILRLVSWLSVDKPAETFAVFTWIVAGIIAAVALAGPWRTRIWGPFVFLSAVYAFFFTLDVASGSSLVADSPIGYSTLLGARFYGAGNEVFTMFSTGSIIALGFIGEAIYQRWHKERPRATSLGIAATIAVLGGCVVIINGSPNMGADFGGPLAFIPALLVLATLTMRKKVSLTKIIAVGAATVGAVMLVAGLDWMRPVQKRTHLGRFVQSIIDGNLLDVVWSKLMLNMNRLMSTGDRAVIVMAIAWVVLVWFMATRKPGKAIGAAAMDMMPLYRWPLAPSREYRAAARQGWSGRFYWFTRSHWYRQYGWLAPRTADSSARIDGALSALPAIGWSVLVLQAVAVMVNDSGINIAAIACLAYIPLSAELLLSWVAHRRLAD